MSAAPSIAGRLARGTGAQPVLDDRADALRLAAVVRHPDYPSAMAFGPPASSWLDLVLPLVMVIAGGLALGRIVGTVGLGLATAALLGLAVPWFVAAALVARDAWRDRGSLLRRQIALVTDVTPAASVVLQLESGTRRLVHCPPGLAAALAIGDVGVAYAKGDRLIAFCRFDV